MADVTIARREFDAGYIFTRSDKVSFCLVWQGGGHAVLFVGDDPSNLPEVGIVEFDETIPDKAAASERWILAHPKMPDAI